ncbi:MAG TPA: response regulator FixJ [Nitrospiraceae bacterium]|nr:response regulator FixJ [Nitrospiraceae bacterium]
MSSKSTIYVIDDDAAARDSLAFLLKSAKLTVQAFESADLFAASLPSLERGCIVTDIRMPGMSGLELLKHIRKQANPMPVIVITGHGDIPLAVEAMRHGAADFLEKPFDDEVILASVTAALDQQQRDGERDAYRTVLHERLATLSTRERQVLESLVAGLPNKSIAFDLGISPRTVEIYRANVMTKMDAGSLSELVRMALLSGIIPSST